MSKIKFIKCPIKGCIKINEEGCDTCPVYQAYLIGVETGMQQCDVCKLEAYNKWIKETENETN